MPESTNVDDLLASQVDYYRAHAPRYDDWWSGTGKHDHGDRYRRSWESEKAKLSAALLARAPLGDVLEFAGGTGRWTAELVPLADSVTVVDAAPEPVAIAQGKIGSDKVTWVIDDIFEHRPVRRYDAVFFSFWLSHVPSARFEQFWALIDDCLKPAGQVIFMDNAHPSRPRTSRSWPHCEGCRRTCCWRVSTAAPIWRAAWPLGWPRTAPPMT